MSWSAYWIGSLWLDWDELSWVELDELDELVGLGQLARWAACVPVVAHGIIESSLGRYCRTDERQNKCLFVWSTGRTTREYQWYHTYRPVQPFDLKASYSEHRYKRRRLSAQSRNCSDFASIYSNAIHLFELVSVRRWGHRCPLWPAVTAPPLPLRSPCP